MITKRLKHTMVRLSGSANTWKNKLPNVPCFILGNAPSITKHPLAKLENYFSIGINKAYKLIDPTIILWQDIEFWYTDREGIAKSKAIKFCRNIADPQGKYFNFKLQSGAFSLPVSPSILYGSGTSGPLAFQLAWTLGCNPIILLGMDCKYQGDKTDFYGKNPYHKPHTLSNCARGLKWIKNCGSDRKIYNCSENDIFDETYSLDQVFNELDASYKPSGRESFVSKILSP